VTAPQAARVRRVLITGSRTWEDRAAIRDALARVWAPGVVLVSGAASRGADALCEQCWQHWGGQVERHPADWSRHGKKAGPLRNQEMVAAGADLCLAFIQDHSPGSSQTAALAEQMGIPTRRIERTSGDRADSTVSQQPKPRDPNEVPISQLPHLAGAAARRGDRLIRVDPTTPQTVRTPGREPGQWLGSGQRLRPVPPQYVTEAEIEQVERAKRSPIPGHAFAGLASNREREETER
jgi:hypothetical protein